MNFQKQHPFRTLVIYFSSKAFCDHHLSGVRVMVFNATFNNISVTMYIVISLVSLTLVFHICIIVMGYLILFNGLIISSYY